MITLSAEDRFIAVDWGTTNRRIFIVENGVASAVGRDSKGVTSVYDFEDEVVSMRAQYGSLPMVLAGMVGSNLGWRPVPYVEAPAGAHELAAGLATVGDGITIVPGVCVRNPADVMRGEEVQLIGAAVAGQLPPEALVVQPGTHAKWVRMREGAVCRFTTTMTGELFALLRNHSVLAANITGPVRPGPAFVSGVRRGAKGDLLSALFGIRATSLMGESSDPDEASHASGILIGAEVASMMANPGEIYVLAEAGLGDLYAVAIDELGGKARRADSTTSFVAGITAILDAR